MVLSCNPPFVCTAIRPSIAEMRQYLLEWVLRFAYTGTSAQRKRTILWSETIFLPGGGFYCPQQDSAFVFKWLPVFLVFRNGQHTLNWLFPSVFMSLFGGGSFAYPPPVPPSTTICMRFFFLFFFSVCNHGDATRRSMRTRFNNFTLLGLHAKLV